MEQTIKVFNEHTALAPAPAMTKAEKTKKAKRTAKAKRHAEKKVPLPSPSPEQDIGMTSPQAGNKCKEVSALIKCSEFTNSHRTTVLVLRCISKYEALAFA